MVGEIIKLGAPWPYDSVKCDKCEHFERSLPGIDDIVLVACDSKKSDKDGRDVLCVIDNTVVYCRR